MRKLLPWLAGALLYPALAAAHSPQYLDDPGQRLWVGLGFGGGTVTSAAPAPAADHSVVSGTIDAGYRFTPEWGLGVEFGGLSPQGGCGGHHCTAAKPDFAPDFTHWFLVGEYRPGGGELRLRAGAGVSSMCYRQYKSQLPGWESSLLAAIFDDESNSLDDVPAWRCKNLQAFGASISMGYQWLLPNSHASVGVQLRGEAADFADSSKAGTGAFQHRALMMEVQLKIN